MNNNKLIIAAAGSGKTTFLICEALKQKEGRVLITTFTEANEDGIRQKFIEKNKCIPENVTVQTWFSFLLQHGVRPYQGLLFDRDINGLVLESGQSVRGTKEADVATHYFTSTKKIYSDKLAKFVTKCNEINNGEVIKRLSRIYSHIFIDEVQDLAGYDLVVLKLLFASTTEILLVGDPRQGTYSTNNSSKNKKFKKSNIINFFEDTSMSLTTDNSSLTTNYRSIQPICDLSNKLYPAHKQTNSGNAKNTGHDGIFLIKPTDMEGYLQKFKPMQLRDSIRSKGVNENYEVITFGKSKGLEFSRILIHPTEPFNQWLKNNDSELAPTSRSKLYVALTRAMFSVGIVFEYDDTTSIEGVQKYVPT
jgi:superfamily I DNA/RNA helicase